ncbi:DUF1707 and DUF2154 domain-containing protein [Plantactinospora sp. S1510]|uniref:DUF1707 and DUF2154 domain-containing protein n=1 Tax=Plantactinospora alkalitolerans TaxID=2789879 RepID=A0ABS0H883_9ACTN|nr:DUF1707 domain-containing protein [Plantactinospora alkalitolerans]MBF9134680.1 DUF1707 and DUF2154 domain-containing protein [Plantactinospora alkalitolerans]
MSGDAVPSKPKVRISDADRESVVARLNVAVGEGRLTLPEFEERLDGVFRAQTYGDVEPFVADLPATVVTGAPSDVVELRSHAGNIKRTGRWAVPRRLVVHSMAGSVKLDLRHAVVSHRMVEIVLATQAGSTTIVLPPGATANIDGVSTSAGTTTIRVPAMPEPGSTTPHIVITGSTAAGTLVVRYERRFWRWRW